MRHPTKDQFIKEHGGAAYKDHLQQWGDWNHAHREERNICNQERARANPEITKRKDQQTCRKEGRRYAYHLKYNTTGLPREKELIRKKHRRLYQTFKQLIAPDSQIHHEWVSGTPEYTGVALVEVDQHMHGYIDVIKILDGKITLLTEEKVKGVL